MANLRFVVLRYYLPALFLFALFISTLSAAPLSIEVISGQNAINNVTRGTAFEPLIEVRDAAGKPVPRANVTFTLPPIGPGGVFTDGSKTLMIQTDPSGRAVARGLRPNNQVGQFEIRVIASLNGQTASAVVTQTNAAPAAASARSGKKLAIILAVLGGGAAAAAVALGGGGGSSGSPGGPGQAPSADPPAGSVTPGAPGFGPPQ